jgi:hypothetical protein
MTLILRVRKTTGNGVIGRIRPQLMGSMIFAV